MYKLDEISWVTILMTIILLFIGFGIFGIFHITYKSGYWNGQWDGIEIARKIYEKSNG